MYYLVQLVHTQVTSRNFSDVIDLNTTSGRASMYFQNEEHKLLALSNIMTTFDKIKVNGESMFPKNFFEKYLESIYF